MDGIDLTSLGANGAVGAALVIIFVLVKHLMSRNGAGKDTERWKDLFRLVRQIHSWDSDLHEWHSKTDDEGVKLWYVRKSLEEAVVKLAENIDKQTDILRQMHVEMMSLRKASET